VSSGKRGQKKRSGAGRSVEHLGRALVGAGAEGDPRHHERSVWGGAGGRGGDGEEEEEEGREEGGHSGGIELDGKEGYEKRGNGGGGGIPISKASDPGPGRCPREGGRVWCSGAKRVAGRPEEEHLFFFSAVHF
jgi:hypothetical protein